MDVDTHLQPPLSVRNTQFLTERLHAYLNEPALDVNSEDEPDERSDASSTTSSDSEEYHPARKTRRVIDLENLGSDWFPWPDKETCVLDILRHIPRCSFSKKQNTAIHWGMTALGLRDLPSDRVMDDIDKALQPLCGIQSVRYSGKLGHIYYVNDLAAIIAQEMANPSVREKLHFYPEDSDPSLSQAWQAGRWREELDSDLTTPMIRIKTQDFFIHEPTVLRDGTVCMPTRWFERGNQQWAQVWKMREYNHHGTAGWLVDSQKTYEIKSSDLLLSFPDFIRTHAHRKLSDPRIIHGMQINTVDVLPWTKTNTAEGNRWRKQATGHRVVAFPVWLYCDDTSGNTSKRWNKHNSFLFTAAGLPRKYVHLESNIHFLSTSNIAPPLEMLDGIIEQLEACQETGIWAWDAHYQELILVIPSVLAMLGDNPMQSEFACHIGFRGKLFCRTCWAKGDPESDDEDDDNTDADGGKSDETGLSDTSTGPAGSGKETKKKRKKKKKKNLQTVPEMISRVRQFMSRGTARNRNETRDELRSQFELACEVGGQAEFKRRKTDSGIKDTYQGVFLDRLFAISTKRGRRTKPQKLLEMAAVRRTFPADITSPVWRIKDFDPHQDTPVEILHVILLGFVKYFWRDAVARLKKPEDKELLIARLSSFNVSGLGISPLSGHTLVTYAGSLTGRDFRAIVQAAPFVLQGLLPKEKIHAWAALSAVVTLVWQPHIKDLDKYIGDLEDAIDHFLDCTCRLSLNWFNKPKFHVILHLPAHIRRFGPAMLFATKSFNAIIRACSVHSNRHAPSRDIAICMARGNRLRHLLSGGFFRQNAQPDPEIPETDGSQSIHRTAPSGSPWMRIPFAELAATRWVGAGKGARSLLDLNSFGSRLLGLGESEGGDTPGTCSKIGKQMHWSATESAKAGVLFPALNSLGNADTLVYTPGVIILTNGDACRVGDSVVYDSTTDTGTYRRIGRVIEIVQVLGSPAEQAGKADLVVVARTVIGESHNLYCMRRVQEMDEVQSLNIKVSVILRRSKHDDLYTLRQEIQCTVNVQHNCADNKCALSRSKKIYQEHEEVSQKALEVGHLSKTDCVVSTGQMRDAAILQTFRVKPKSLVREGIVRAAAELEFEARKTKEKELKLAAAPPPPPAVRPAVGSSLRQVLNNDVIMQDAPNV
ncbi:hypothetical protein DFH07DRAFT_376904 [Mycena maculata]|uniref:Uncharacterized protein n=1 Tax=Mycena maculata TaxID=230809 RepID=A0AAD7JJC2_9AGAR|nr:hypothetical protein DFH07DRAFT_376904 [Mycena maculata]